MHTFTGTGFAHRVGQQMKFFGCQVHEVNTAPYHSSASGTTTSRTVGSYRDEFGGRSFSDLKTTCEYPICSKCPDENYTLDRTTGKCNTIAPKPSP